MKLLSLACLISLVAAVAVPGDDWKAWKCPAPVTVTATVTSYSEKVIKQPVTEYQTVTQTEYKTATVTATEYKTATVTQTQKEVQTVTQVQYKTVTATVTQEKSVTVTATVTSQEYKTVTATVTAYVTKVEEKVCPTPVPQTSSKWGDWN